MYPGMKILLCGYPGSGKTHSLRTIPDNHPVRGIFTDPGGIAIGAPYCESYVSLPPVTGDLETLMEYGLRINTSTVENLVKGYGGNREKYRQFLKLMEVCNDYKDLGPTMSWDNKPVLWLDHLTGITKMARQLTTGNRPIISLPEYGIVQQALLEFMEILILSCSCHVVFVSHLDVGTNQFTGVKEFMPSTIGQKLGPQLGINFTDVILANRSGRKFIWQTLSNEDMVLKANHLPWEEDLPPDFGPLFERWEERAANAKDDDQD